MQFIITIRDDTTKYIFNRHKFTSLFPDSLITTTLNMSSDTDIEFTQPFITPNVINMLSYITEHEYVRPDFKSFPELIQAGDYLNIDILTIIGDEKWIQFTKMCPEINLLKIGKLFIVQIFMYAVHIGHLSLVKYLINKGADPSISYQKIKNCALTESCIRGHTHLVRYLLKDKRIDPNDNVVIRFASLLGHIDIVNLLLEDPRVNPSLRVKHSPPSSALVGACKHGHINIVNRLLDCKVDPSEGNQRPLYIASVRGHQEVVDRLLEDKRVFPTQHIFRMTSIKGHVDIIKRFLSYPNINCHGYERWGITSPEIMNLFRERLS